MNFHESFIVTDAWDGKRLDQCLWQTGRFASRSRAQELVRRGVVRCNGDVVRKTGFKVMRGQTIAYHVPPRAPDERLMPQPRDASVAMVNVLYEDDEVLVVNKPQGLCVHAGAGNPHGTLVEYVLGRGIALSAIGLPLRPGIVHRLDKGTSGVMVLGKTDRAHLELARQFAEKEVRKIYIALVIGKPALASMTIRNFLGRHPKHRQKFASASRHGKTAVTHMRVLGACGPFAWVEARPETGRTHQIRVHLSEAGHPIVGDALYGGGRKRLAALVHMPELADFLRDLDHPCLHAYRLSFVHPVSREELVFTAPLPDYLRPFVDISMPLSL